MKNGLRSTMDSIQVSGAWDAGSIPAGATDIRKEPLLVSRLARVFWFILKHY